jgi:hypothetical protein
MPGRVRTPGVRTIELAKALLADQGGNAEVAVACAGIPEDRVRLLASDQALPGAVLQLPARAAERLARLHVVRAYARLIDDKPGDPGFGPSFKSALEGLAQRVDPLGWSPDASAASRILRRGPETFDAFLDGAAQAVILAERTHPLPRAIARQLDEKHALAQLDRLAGEAIDVLLNKSVRHDLATTVPAPSLVLLERAGIRIHVTVGAEALDGPFRRVRQVLGDELAAQWSPHNPLAVGEFGFLVGELKLHGLLGQSTGHAIGTARHELCHAIDHALGKDGLFASDEPDFRDIFEQTKRRAEQTDDLLAVFPTAYAATDNRELFAESAAIFLGPYFDDRLGGGGVGDIVATRDDLKRKNPAVYEFVEDVFARRVPAAVAMNQLNAHTQTTASIDRVIREIEALKWHPFETRSRNLTLACLYALRGRLNKDHADEREALRYARAVNRGVRRLLFEPLAAGLADRLARRLGHRAH